MSTDLDLAVESWAWNGSSMLYTALRTFSSILDSASRAALSWLSTGWTFSPCCSKYLQNTLLKENDHITHSSCTDPDLLDLVTPGHCILEYSDRGWDRVTPSCPGVCTCIKTYLACYANPNPAAWLESSLYVWAPANHDRG